MSANNKKSKNGRGKKKNNTAAIIFLFILIALIVVGVINLTSTIKEMNEKESPTIADTVSPEPNEKPSVAADPIEEDPSDDMPYYYDASREARYAAYAAEHPEIPIEDVYWMVDCDLDNPPYVDTQETVSANDIMVLVNKQHHLPEGYEPPYLLPVGKTMMHPEAAGALLEMIADAAEAGHDLWSQSGYRSYEVQTGLYTNYSARDGVEAADTYSARPGYSEHQTGLATDLNTITDAFGGTPEGIWAAENCWKYGFIIRYTAENTDITLYKSEPWHLRYVGPDAAKTIRDEQITTYEEYWVKYVKYTPPAGGSEGSPSTVG